MLAPIIDIVHPLIDLILIDRFQCGLLEFGERFGLNVLQFLELNEMRKDVDKQQASQ